MGIPSSDYLHKAGQSILVLARARFVPPGRLAGDLEADRKPGPALRVSGGISERYNQGISGNFDFNAQLPYSSLVQAAYAANPIPEVPASQFKVRAASITWVNRIRRSPTA